MCAQTKVVINCCGPYRLYGEPVVKAAVENKANYVDISGEPQARAKLFLSYFGCPVLSARESNIEASLSGSFLFDISFKEAVIYLMVICFQ